MNKAPILVLGAGAYGTALAIAIAKTGTPTYLWSHNSVKAFQMAMGRQNADRLPGINFPECLHIISSLEDAIKRSRDIIIAVPSSAFRELLNRMKPAITKSHRIIWATKGFDTESGKLLSDVVSEIISPDIKKAVLAGPAFAVDVANDKLTSMVLASEDKEFALEIKQRLFNSHKLRIYISDDIIGVQLGGAAKNVIAIAAGACDALNLGANARSTLVVRGLYQIIRLGLHLGANPQTFIGMSGIGDLMLTCMDNNSRNLRFGRAIAQGISVEQARLDIGSSVQGINNAKEIYLLSKQHGSRMLLTEAVYKVLYEQVPIKEAVRVLIETEVEDEEIPPFIKN